MNEFTPNNFNNLTDFLPDFPNTVPQEPFEYLPPTPSKRRRIPNLPPQLLARRIYFDMQKATRDYGKLENLAPQQNKQNIRNLQNQMQILALTMLRVYNDLNGRNSLPFFTTNNPPLPNNYQRALQEMYNRVYHIHDLTLRLYNRVNNTSTAQTVLIVLLNLKSQLRQLNNLLTK